MTVGSTDGPLLDALFSLARREIWLTYMLLDELQVLCILCAVIGEFHAREQGRDEVIVGRVDAVLDLAVGHPGQVARLAVEGIRREFSSWWDGEPAIGQRDVGRCQGGAGERQLQERSFHGGQVFRSDAEETRKLMKCCKYLGFISSTDRSVPDGQI